MAEELKQVKQENVELVAQVEKLQKAADDTDGEDEMNKSLAALNVEAVTLKAKLSASEKEC